MKESTLAQNSLTYEAIQCEGSIIPGEGKKIGWFQMLDLHPGGKKLLYKRQASTIYPMDKPAFN